MNSSVTSSPSQARHMATIAGVLNIGESEDHRILPFLEDAATRSPVQDGFVLRIADRDGCADIESTASAWLDTHFSQLLLLAIGRACDKSSSMMSNNRKGFDNRSLAI
jgi:hypothetical protein